MFLFRPEVRGGRRRVGFPLLVAGAVAGYLVLAVLVAGRWGPLIRLDGDVARAAHQAVLASAALLETAHAATQLGEGAVRTGAALLVCTLLLARQRWRSAMFLAVTVGLGAVLNPALKGLLDRPRPALPDPVAVATGSSFPSGHGMGAAVLAASLLLLAWPALGRGSRPVAARSVVLVVVALVVGAVAASRVLLGVHYLSDVVAGTLAGLVWVAATAVVLLGWRPGRRRPRRVSAAPISLRWVRRAR